MRSRVHAAVTVLAVLLAAGVARSEDEPRVPGTSCVDAVLARVQCTNPEDVCRQILTGRDPHESIAFDSMFEVRQQDLGDGTIGYVFSRRGAGDAYALVPNFHFAPSGGALVLYFDGHGVPATYLTDRGKVNGRYQIERVTRADIPGLYKKRDAERWFWTGGEYAKAFTRLTIEQAKDPKLNGTTTTWDPAGEQAYRNAGGAGGSWTHTVVAGDTLGAISAKHGVSIDEIMRQNDIRSAGSLRIGQKIRYEGWKVNAR
jgi:LysM domain-containing protein